jgi:hypothetical protein
MVDISESTAEERGPRQRSGWPENMYNNQKITNLQQLVKQVEMGTKDKQRVSLGSILEIVGQRSFAPVLLLAGLVMFAPVIGDIPGVPVIMGLLVISAAGQLLFHRDHLWMPSWLLKRSVSQDKLDKTLKRLQRPARFVDRFLRQRLTLLTDGAVVYLIAIICIVLAAATPAMEFVPFSANVAGAVIIAFALALIARDGLLALIAFALTTGLICLVIYQLL